MDENRTQGYAWTGDPDRGSEKGRGESVSRSNAGRSCMEQAVIDCGWGDV